MMMMDGPPEPQRRADASHAGLCLAVEGSTRYGDKWNRPLPAAVILTAWFFCHAGCRAAESDGLADRPRRANRRAKRDGPQTGQRKRPDGQMDIAGQISGNERFLRENRDPGQMVGGTRRVSAPARADRRRGPRVERHVRQSRRLQLDRIRLATRSSTPHVQRHVSPAPAVARALAVGPTACPSPRRPPPSLPAPICASRTIWPESPS